jgi:hypothetical protein
MNERDLEARLRRTYLAEAERADPGALIERVHSIPATVEPERRRWWHGLGSGVARLTGSNGEQAIGGIKMLTSMRAAAVVAVLALTTTVLALQVASPTETVAPGVAEPGGAEPGGAWVTVTGTQEILSTTGGRGSLISAMSDERLSGNIAITWSADAEGPSADENNDVLWGATTITNDGGTWEGQWVGFVDDQGRHHITSWHEGTGDYEGLRYIEQGTQRVQGGLIDVTGLIFRGMAPSTVIPAQVVE